MATFRVGRGLGDPWTGKEPPRPSRALYKKLAIRASIVFTASAVA